MPELFIGPVDDARRNRERLFELLVLSRRHAAELEAWSEHPSVPAGVRTDLAAIAKEIRARAGGRPLMDDTVRLPEGSEFPVPKALDNDKRFTFGLTLDVLRVLVDHGYPETKDGIDYVRLQQALFGFIYGDSEVRT